MSERTCGNCLYFLSEIKQFMIVDTPIADEEMKCNFFNADILCEIENCPCWKPRKNKEQS
jgi:hypothetical protein